jgi:hypothetical protein
MQKLMWKVLLGYAVLSVLLLKRREWASPRGGLVVATVLIFAAYLLVPDKGLGGTEAKIRFSWVFFVLVGLVTCVASRLRFLRAPAALIFAWFAFVNAQATARTAGAVSALADDYLAVAGRVTPGASLVRLRYPTPQLAAQYGYEGVGRDPVFHLDALEAARKHGVDLSDYEALTEIFGVIYKPYLDKGQLSGLWSFEGPDPDSDKTLKWINDSFPHPVDFVLVVGDLRSPAAERMGMPKMMEYLESTMQPVAESKDGFFRLFRKENAVGRR